MGSVGGRLGALVGTAACSAALGTGCIPPQGAGEPAVKETPLVDAKSLAEVSECREIAKSSTSASESGPRGLIAARNDLRREATARGASHILFVKAPQAEQERHQASTQSAIFYDCDAKPELATDGEQAPAAPPPQKQEAAAAGTCFFVNDSGLAVTNRHVVDGAISISVTLNDGSTREAMLVRQQPNLDLALLQVRGSVKTAFLVPADTLATLGEQVFTIGFPFGEALGTDPKFVEGSIGSLRVASDDRIMQTSMIVHPGNSGGALVRFDGGLVGVVFAKANQMTFLEHTGSLAEGISFAVKAPMVQRLLGADAPKVPTTTRNRGEAIDNAVRATCRVVAKYDGSKF